MGNVDQQIVENNVRLEFEEVQELCGPEVVYAELFFRYFLAIDEHLCKPCSFTSTSLTFLRARTHSRLPFSAVFQEKNL